MIDLSQLIIEENNHDIMVEQEIEKEIKNAEKEEKSVVENTVQQNTVVASTVNNNEAKIETKETKDSNVENTSNSISNNNENKEKETVDVKTSNTTSDDSDIFIMPQDDKYLRNLKTYTWIEDPVDGEIKIYKINKDKVYEKRTKYRYLAPTLVEKYTGSEILSFLELSGSFVYTVITNGFVITVNDTITGYYPAVVTITSINTRESINIKVKHNEAFIKEILNSMKIISKDSTQFPHVFAKFMSEE